MTDAPNHRPLAYVNGHVYFMRPVGLIGPVKIGWSKLPAGRLLEYGRWSPFPLEIAATAKGDAVLETTLHKVFAYCHSHMEWFHPSQELIEGIEALRRGAPVESAFNLNKAATSLRHWRTRSDRRETAVFS